jgi:hypothetical protein
MIIFNFMIKIIINLIVIGLIEITVYMIKIYIVLNWRQLCHCLSHKDNESHKFLFLKKYCQSMLQFPIILNIDIQLTTYESIKEWNSPKNNSCQIFVTIKTVVEIFFVCVWKNKHFVMLLINLYHQETKPNNLKNLIINNYYFYDLRKKMINISFGYMNMMMFIKLISLFLLKNK